MKKYLTLTLAFMTGLSFAQPYNNTYDVNGNNDQLGRPFNIVNNNQESITVVDGYDPIANSNYFTLTRLNVAGGVVCNSIVRAPNDPIGGYLYVEALHQTPDRGVIVGGYYFASRNPMILQPFLAKFDNMCNMVWHRIYPVNQQLIVNAAINKVSLCRVQNISPNLEYYYFVVAGDSDINPGVDVATNVLQVDGSNAGAGALIFSNKYYPVGATPVPNLREYPGDIEYSPAQQMYMITGYRQTGPASAVVHEMYHFGILNNGAMFNGAPPPFNFLTQASNSIPVDQDMVYEAATGQFATAFTHDLQGYVAGIQSIIGFVKVNPALVIANPQLIWHNNGDRHNGRSISNMAPNGFAICAGVRDANNFLNNPALQLVNPAGVPVSLFMRYNVLDDVYFGHHAWNPTRNEFILASEHNTALPEELRVISTNPAGNACGMREYDYKYQSYTPSPKLHEYQPIRFDKDLRFSLNWQPYVRQPRVCMPPGNSYRMTGLSSFTADNLNVRVYPSVMSKSNTELTIENGSGAELHMEVRSITGQLIQSSESVGVDKTTVKLSQDLSAGVYMVHFYSADGNISATEKILISE